MAFRSGSLTYTISVPLKSGGSTRVSSGTRNLQLAKRMEHAVHAIGRRGSQDWALLDAITKKRISMPDFFEAWERRDLSRLFDRINDLNLEPFVEDWHEALVNRTRDNYRRTVRLFIPEYKPFLRSAFTREAIKTYLDQWHIGSTRNRYRYALHSFAEWLVDAGHLRENPILSLKRAKDPPPRMVYYSEAMSKAVIACLPAGAHQALEALMCSTGMEWSACLAVRRLDIDPAARTIEAKGTKAACRTRTVVFTQDWAWRIFWPYAQGFTPTAHLFTMSYHMARRAHIDAVKAANATPGRMHDWRHTFAVRLRRQGEPDWKIAGLLGHRDTMLLARVYGRFKPEATELQTKSAKESE